MVARLAAIPNLKVTENVPLSRYARFELGGPARLLADAGTEAALSQAIQIVREENWPWTVIGGGSNLVVDDAGFPGVVVRHVASQIVRSGDRLTVDSGVLLQNLVDNSISLNLRGLETMTGIPGWVAGAVYGNAGAYGHSIEEYVERVRFFDGQAFQEIDNRGCEFDYRESVFKRHKQWVITSAVLRLAPGDGPSLKAHADEILRIRNEKYPPSMRCAGSIFKNLMLRDLPESVRAQVPERVMREGKVPSAYFLEQAGAKGMRNGGIRVAEYHANLIYNETGGTSAQLRQVIDELKSRVEARFGLVLEEEVQYIGAARQQSGA
jgi:UDP-N-acetylmuramate dehydrogenase